MSHSAGRNIDKKEVLRLPTEQRHHAHASLDRLPAGQLSAVCGLLESMLSPFDRKLALAVLDD
jgi:hypothetical protein